MADDERVQGVNPKYPTMVGYKMASLWDMIWFERYRISKTEGKLADDYKEELRRFRRRWGNKPPASESEWLDFWHQFRAIEDEIEKVQSKLHSINEEIEDVVRQGREIVAQNGIDLNGADPVGEIARLLAQARAHQEEE